MKRFLYLCTLIIMSLNAMAQINLNDPNWECVFSDDFSHGRTWNSSSWQTVPDKKWRAYNGHSITHGKDHERQIYQYDHCVFDTVNGVVNLVSEYDAMGKIPDWDYSLPHNVLSYPNVYGMNSNNHANSDSLYMWYFFSGWMEVLKMKFCYGYFEIRCKLPLHNGAFTAFWLYGTGNNTYEEIDIFEHSENDCEGDRLRGYSSSIWHNPNGTTSEYKYYEQHHHLPLTSPDFGQFHTFGCEWTSNYVKYYCDGVLMSEYNNKLHIPVRPKYLIIDYALNELSLNNNNSPDGWSGTDVMTIDYVRVYQLRADCETDEYITNSTQFVHFDRRLKNSITIGSSSNAIVVPQNTNMTMYADEFILIDGEFELPVGAKLQLQTENCHYYIEQY